jgi:F0F1-type ATP synthase membrane subunit b/b'
MKNENTLNHLLKVEAEAAALVKDAQAEADRRIHENEEKNRAAYEERFKAEAQMRELSLKKEKDRLRKQYQTALEEYRKEISGVNVDVQRFSNLLNEFIAGDG